MPEYTLYVLVAREADAAGQDSHSPFVLRTVVDFALLGLKYDRAPLIFLQVRNELAKETGNDKVTVPTLKTQDGEYVTDSWKIAEYLNKTHGTPSRNLFSGESGASLARFVSLWTDLELSPAMRELFRPLFWTLNDAPSAEYFIRVKCGNDAEGVRDAVDRLRNPARKSEVEAITKVARGKLAVVERLLAEQGPYIHGKEPGHGDSALFGWYLSSQAGAPVVNELLWEHADVPHVKAWVARMKDKTGVKVKFEPVS